MKSSQDSRTNEFDAIIIGGSYAGLSAAMCFARAAKQALVIDSGRPCNYQVPHAHNFITQDGESPAVILAKTREQLKSYETIKIIRGKADTATKQDNKFQVTTESGDQFTCKKLIITTGVKDIMPPIPGFAECWGVSIHHCPYCHGYEIRNQPWGILANGVGAFLFCKKLYSFTDNLTVFTNGPSTLTHEQKQKLDSRGISVVEKKIESIEHENGQMKDVVFADGTKQSIAAMYTRPDFEQTTDIPAKLGCKMTEEGFIEVNGVQKTSVGGVYAAGDCTTLYRVISVAVAGGTLAGAFADIEMNEENF